MTNEFVPRPSVVGMFRKSVNMNRVVQVCTERCYAGLLAVERVDEASAGKGCLGVLLDCWQPLQVEFPEVDDPAPGPETVI